MARPLFLIAACACFLLAGCAATSEVAPAVAPEPAPAAAPAIAPAAPPLEEQVDAFLMPLVERDLATGTVLIARGDEILLAKGYGPANRELGIDNGPDLRYRVGSVTKQFTALAVMILAERGLVDIDAPLSAHLPDVAHADSVTPYQLMTHTSGVPSYNRMPDYGEKYIQPLTITEVAAWFGDEELLFAPGTDFAYSNSGYVLLALLIEEVSGMSYDDFLAEAVFTPLGMAGSGVDVYTTVMPGRADGYGSDGQEIYRAPYRDMPFTSGAGSLLSTANDLLKWNRAITTDALVSAETRERIFTVNRAGYGCGWFVGERFGRRLHSHRGDINGFRCDVQRWVDDDVTVIVLLNLESTFALSIFNGLGAIAVGADHEPVLDFAGMPVAADVLDRYPGTYAVGQEYRLEIERTADGLTAHFEDEPPTPLIAQSPTLFFAEGMNSMLRFDTGEDGTVARILATQGARRFAATPLPEEEATGP